MLKRQALAQRVHGRADPEPLGDDLKRLGAVGRAHHDADLREMLQAAFDAC